jgi:hypothetical protein
MNLVATKILSKYSGYIVQAHLDITNQHENRRVACGLPLRILHYA